MSVKAVTGVACTAGGAGCIAGVAVEGLRYSSWGDPGAINICVALFWTALVLLSVPAAMITVWFFRELHRDLRRAGLSTGQAAFVEAAAMGAAHYAWAAHNREWSERLTDSVMGPVRTDPAPGAYELRGPEGAWLTRTDGRQERL